MMIKSRAKQQGMSMVALFFVLAVGGILLLAAFRLAPLYIDNYFVKGALDLLDQEDVNEMTNGAIRRKLDKLLLINNVRDMSSKDLEIDRKQDRVIVSIQYEKRVNFVGNIDFVVMFNNVYDSADRS